MSNNSLVVCLPALKASASRTVRRPGLTAISMLRGVRPTAKRRPPSQIVVQVQGATHGATTIDLHPNVMEATVPQSNRQLVLDAFGALDTGDLGEIDGFAPTGRSFSVQQIHICRVTDGQISEHWACRDDLGAARQLGLVSR